jgi:hypothetical protein
MAMVGRNGEFSPGMCFEKRWKKKAFLGWEMAEQWRCLAETAF